MTTGKLGAHIDGVTTLKRTVTLDVLAPKGKAAGVTARFVLRFRTSGDVTKKVTVSGRLFLTQSPRRCVADLRVRRGEGSQVMRRRIGRVTRLVSLALVLGVVALAIPDSGVKSTEITLVKIDNAQATAIGPDVISILAVGSDARPGEDMTHSRGDALQLVTINTRTHAASIIGVPRDSWVDIPGHGTDKINSSLYFGGPQLLGQTVGNLIGVQPKYVFVTRFPYFIAMVKSIGGVDVHNPYAFSDDPLKPSGFPAGKIHLGGYDAMAYSRIRHTLPAR